MGNFAADIGGNLSGKCQENKKNCISSPFYWCAREDLNLHPLRDQILSLARLPFRHSRDAGRQDDIHSNKLKEVFPRVISAIRLKTQRQIYPAAHIQLFVIA